MSDEARKRAEEIYRRHFDGGSSIIGAIADAIEKAVEEEQRKKWGDVIPVALVNMQSEIDRLKAELGRMTNERDESQRFNAQYADWLAQATREMANSKERLHHAKESSKSVWVQHEEQFKQLTTERDALKLKLEECWEMIETMLSSAHPRRVEHPTMWEAWNDARALLAAQKGQQ